jgi:hypothetical protein
MVMWLIRPPQGRSWETGGGGVMVWEAPAFVEVRMDAELSAYQAEADGS